MKEPVFTPKAPAPVGPYSQAIRVGPWLFLSGQIPINPDTQQIEAGDVESQTRRVMENLAAVLHEAGGSLEHLVHVTIYLSNLEDFPTVNRVYAEYVGKIPPARATVQVGALPKGARVEVTGIARIPSTAPSPL